MLELNKIYFQDCLEGIKLIDDKSIDMTITSPPYDNLRTYGNISQWNFNIFQSIANELFRITKNGGVIVWVVGDATIKGSETGTSFKQALYFKDIGFNLHDTMIFAKTNPPPLTHNRYDPAFEYMFILSKRKPKTFNPLMEECINKGKTHNRNSNYKAIGEEGYSVRQREELTTVKELKYRKNIWHYTVGHGDSGSHPAPFPDQLVYDHLISWSNEKDIVLDPFMGSGTTALACKNLNRNFIGFENNQEYYKVACERIGQII